MHRSGQPLFLPSAKLKQKEKMSTGHLLFFIAAIYMVENQNGYIVSAFLKPFLLFFSIPLTSSFTTLHVMPC